MAASLSHNDVGKCFSTPVGRLSRAHSSFDAIGANCDDAKSFDGRAPIRTTSPPVHP